MRQLCCPGKGRSGNFKKALSLPVCNRRADDRGYINSVLLRTRKESLSSLESGQLRAYHLLI